MKRSSQRVSAPSCILVFLAEPAPGKRKSSLSTTQHRSQDLKRSLKPPNDAYRRSASSGLPRRLP